MKTNYYIHKKLNISDIGYGFFTKNWSLPIDNHTSLNCSHNTNDDQNTVNKNINIAKKKLGLVLFCEEWHIRICQKNGAINRYV